MVLGLDFGTHQSKVCVENDSDPRDIRYTFHEFTTLDGQRSFFLPSVVQINDDDSISYGFCDPARAKEIGEEYLLSKPETPQELPKPRIIAIPPEPNKKGYPPENVFLDSYVRQLNKRRLKKKKKPLDVNALPDNVKEEAKKAYLERISQANTDNEKALAEWQDLVRRIEAKNKKNQQEYEEAAAKAELDYQESMKRWENSRRSKYATYRYFKISTFSREYPWKEDVTAKELSVWYLTYLLLQVKDTLKNVTRIQMGIPQSIRDQQLSDWQTQAAKDIFYAAWSLMEKVGTLEEFQKLRVPDLREMVRTFGMTKDDCINAPGFLVLPEAFASLESITSQGKLSISGLHLLIDIGGGSTDISLFYVTSKSKPNISAIVSVHKGLNYIFRLYRKEHLDMTMEQIRELFAKDTGLFSNQIQQFFYEIGSAVHDKIYTPLVDVTVTANLRIDRLKDALKNRPVVYTGGGGVYEAFHRGVHYFQDPLSISKDLMSVRHITNSNLSHEELAILTVAYGLSMPQRRCPEMVPIDQFYRGIIGEEKKDSPDYGVDDWD